MASLITSGRARAAAALVAILLALLATPLVALAHAELETATPADGAVLSAPPTEIVLTFSEALDPAKSSVTLHDGSGAEIGRGSIDPADDAAMRLIPPSTIAPGAYEIRWTSAGSDGHIERGTLALEVTAPTPSPTAAPTPEPSATPSPSPTPTPSASPSPSPTTDPAGASGSDVLLPILAALAVVAVFGGILLRGRMRGGGSA